MEALQIEWTDYMRYRVELRGYDIAVIEHIVRHPSERYVDNTTGRLVAIGKHDSLLILVPYEIELDSIRPVTVHVVVRSQIEARIKSGRFSHE